MLSPAEFERCRLSWIQALHEATDGQLIAIDGKTLRGSFDKASHKSAIHMIRAWASANLISLRQLEVDAKSNEITAIQNLLDTLQLKGATVTIDAAGCPTAIVGLGSRRSAWSSVIPSVTTRNASLSFTIF